MFNIKRFQDIQIPDITLRQQYYQKFFNGDIAGAQTLYNGNPQLQGKCLNAATLNSLLNSILSLEGYFDTGVTQYLSSALNSLNISVDNLIYIGEWSETETYEINNFVLYESDIYFCIETSTAGILPTDTAHWLNLSLRGQKGAVGLGINYVGAWDVNTIYNEYDMVTYQNELYVAKDTTTGYYPTDPTHWFKALSMITEGIYFSGIAPLESPVGTIWFRDIDESEITWSDYEDYRWGSLGNYTWGDIERGVF